MSRPRLLDLFSGGGGAAMGYHRAGFDVVGVDLAYQPDYPFEFFQGDALWELSRQLRGPGSRFAIFDAIHASPPCKPFTTAKADRDRPALFDADPDLLTPTLEMLAQLSVPWVVENVVGSPMPAGSVTYCGSSFGLNVRRHRLFASNVPLVAPACDHAWQTPRFQPMDWQARLRGQLASVVGVHGSLTGGTDTLALRREAMGIDWLPNDTLTQAIPPAYTEHIGRQLLAVLRAGDGVGVDVGEGGVAGVGGTLGELDFSSAVLAPVLSHAPIQHHNPQDVNT